MFSLFGIFFFEVRPVVMLGPVVFCQLDGPSFIPDSVFILLRYFLAAAEIQAPPISLSAFAGADSLRGELIEGVWRSVPGG